MDTHDDSADRTECRIARRGFLGTAAIGALCRNLAAGESQEPVPHYQIVTAARNPGKTGMPGLFPGRVIEVNGERSIDESTGRIDCGVLRDMLDRGMVELTGARDSSVAWKVFFQPRDRVGIKVNTAGSPQCISSPELVVEVIARLVGAGVRADDIWVYDRFARQMDVSGYDAWVPDGVHVYGAERRNRDLTPYDRDTFVEVDFTGEQDRRSYLLQLISNGVDKIINIPNVKDHSAAGVTGCLKNVTYGGFNNVERSHVGMRTNVRTFVGTLASVEPLRSKVVLNIMDGLMGVWHGGPFGYNPRFLWYPKFLRFGTDPVAIDRLLIETIEKKRKAEGALSILDRDPKNISEVADDPKTSLYIREPFHIQYAGSLGLGVGDLAKIHYRSYRV